jgi:hypothetical protein
MYYVVSLECNFIEQAMHNEVLGMTH